MSAGFPATGPMLVRQVDYQVRTFCRTPIAVFFTIALPLIMLVLFNALFGDSTVDTGSGSWPLSQFYVAGLAAFTAVSATFTNLANTVPIRRDEGVLKRWRGTPLPAWTYLAGLIGSTIVLALAGVITMLALGVVAYDLEIEAVKVPAMILTFLVGVASFAALGMAVAGLCPSASAASAVANAIVLPMAFVSDVFIAIEDPPAWLDTIGDVLPLKPFVQSFQDTLNPAVDAPAFRWGAMARVATWGVIGLVVALRWFRWEPSRGGSTPRRRARRRASSAEQS
ncbi:MAG: ABC transporter permease [Ilumatobacteraceae bacterium]